MYRESFDKIVNSYFAAMAVEPFVYKGKTFVPKTLYVSPLLFRGLDCPAGCGACCPSFSLDYLPEEAPTDIVDLHPVQVTFNDRSYNLMRYDNDPKQRFCNYLDKETARCTIHKVNPFSCSFEIMRFMVGEEQAKFMVRSFGRAWAMMRIDGERGAKCGILEFDEEIRSWLTWQLTRLQEWMAYFDLRTDRVDTTLAWVIDGPHKEPLRFAA